ncbi:MULTISPECIES: AAA family ATPase [Bradyrhizobium]|uniref:AAA family ATPase n=1 Tax=Bradyrhizobium elkanii TaxID=29448 RepID=UPI00041D6F51|nr:AAA family ATPase [Bradyrhizobium elkanii]
MHGSFSAGDPNAQAETGDQALKPDVTAISTHLHALFPAGFVHRWPDAQVEIIYGPPGDFTKSRWFSAFDLKTIVDFVEVRSACGDNIYVGAALRHGSVPESGRANAGNYLAGQYAWCEYDGAGDEERIVAICKDKHLEPAIIVTTGTTPHPRRHLYFRIKDGAITSAAQEAVNVTLRDLFNSDNVKDPIRIMRLGGSFNTPTPEKRKVRGYIREIVTVQVAREPREYSTEELIALCRPAGGETSGYDFNSARSRRTDDQLFELLEKSRIARQWHDSMRDAIASMIGRGWSDDAVRFTCASYCKGGKDDRDLDRLIDGARKKWNRPNPDDNSTASATMQQRPSITATPYIWTEPEKIPPREFLYGRRLIRKYATATIAPGGVGKTALEVAEVLSMVSGKALLGIQTPPLRVWLWSLEDPREEMARRLQAAAKHYNLTAEHIDDRLFVDSGREQPLVIAETTRNGVVIYRPVVEAIIAQLKERAIAVLIIDPFVSCHRVTENDNNAIDAVTKLWAHVADAANCAVELVHHVRKGEQEITVESARGGGSFGDACRMVRVINRMTEQQARDAGVDNHRLYFRTFIDKNNLASPAEKSDWFKLVSVDLGNGPLGPNVGGGDSIGVVTRWEWPDATQDLTGRDFELVATAIRAGSWRADIQAKQWVGRAIAKALGYDLDDRADKAAVKQLMKYWIGTGALVVVKRETEKREMKEFVEVAEKVE